MAKDGNVLAPIASRAKLSSEQHGIGRPQDRRSARVLVLMYHSISSAEGPTSIPPSVFAAQVASLKDLGYQVISLGDLYAWFAGHAELPMRCAAITFDDAFADFAREAAPLLKQHAFTAAVFAPTACIGGTSGWEREPRPLLTWEQMRELASAGFVFGSHARRHADLTKLDPATLAEELSLSRQELEARLGVPAPYFAAPFGRSNARVQQAIRTSYSLAFGVRLGRAARADDCFDIPRIEMHYFRDIARWRAFLDGRAEAYFALRKLARTARASLSAMGA